MRKVTLFAFIWLIAAVFVAPVWAEISVRDYDKARESETLKTYITGVAKGIFWANAVLGFNKQTPLFCPPANLALTGENYRDILNRELNAQKDKYSLDAPIEMILLHGLMSTFPCDGK